MRELVYLSERKLRHFIPDRKRGWRRPTLRGEVGVPGLGQLGAEAAPTDSHLDDVIAHLDATASWYEDDDLQPGQWVHFEARLSYRTYHGDSIIVVLFGQPKGEHQRRLLLHGSPQHLEIGGPRAFVDTSGIGSSGLLFEGLHFGSSGPTFEGVLKELPLSRGLADPEPAADRLQVHERRLHLALDQILSPSSAAWMSGYARVTVATGPSLLVATPLYVAYAPPPDQ